MSNPTLEEMLAQLTSPLQLTTQDLSKYSLPFVGGPILPRFPDETPLDLQLTTTTTMSRSSDEQEAVAPLHLNPASAQISPWVSLMGPPLAPPHYSSQSRGIGSLTSGLFTNISPLTTNASSPMSSCSSNSPVINNSISEIDFLAAESDMEQESGDTKKTTWDQLLLVVRDMRHDIKPCYAGNKASVERLKKSIAQARLLLRETAHELDNGK